MEKTTKNILITFLYLFCLYLAFQLIPYEKMSESSAFQQLIKAFFLFSLLCLCFFEWKKAEFFRRKPTCRRDALITLPLLVACFSNLFVAGIENTQVEQVSLPLFFANTLTLILSCAIEEFLFRKFFLTYLLRVLDGRRAYEMQSILYSSLAFSLMHVINFTSGAYLSVLLQLGYTFALGLVLGILATKLNDDILVILGHIAFNFFNMLLVDTFFVTLAYGFIYYLINSILLVASFLYALFLYFVLERREDNA